MSAGDEADFTQDVEANGDFVDGNGATETTQEQQSNSNCDTQPEGGADNGAAGPANHIPKGTDDNSM